ncbi:MAG: peptide deformylase [Candidatus Solibacter usitatus]|nr:peptide deformylase [Candidatus Solibacter usitatus]
MAIRRILLLGDPALRQVSTPVSDVAAAASVIDDLRDTLHEFQRTHGFGRGISAVQIGALSRVIYIEFEGAPYVLINPAFDHLSAETFELWDDCFSFPGLLVRVKRSCEVGLSFLDQTGNRQTLQASGAFSELLQHEMDHLDGILAVDRALDRNAFCLREERTRQPTCASPESPTR